MAQNFREHFIQERVKALATICLTRRDDLVIRESKDDSGVDYLVHIIRENEPSPKVFGVLLAGTMAPVTEAQANKALRPILEAFQRRGPFPYPVCALYFTMRDDQGYYAWAVEPVVTDKGKPKLIAPAAADCRKLDGPSLDRIVSAVEQWYSALFVELSN